MNSNTRNLFILLILPTLFFVFGTYFDRAFYAGDPNYIYLMNGVNICMDQQVGNADNPGTPVMILSAVVLKVHHFISGADESIQMSVLKNPDQFVALLRFFFDVLNSLVLLFAGIAIFVISKSLWSALLMQLTPFLSVNLLEHVWTKVAPEPLLLFIVMIFSIVVFQLIYDKNRSSFVYPLLFGILTGLGVATKITFIPLIFIPLIIVPRWNKLYYVVLSIISFVIFTLPALHIYSQMFTWFESLFMHSGIYGKGESVIIDPNIYFRNLFLIIYNNQLFGVLSLIMLILLVLMFFPKRFKTLNSNRNGANILLALFICHLAGLLIVAKHYHANHYILPVLSLVGLDMVVIFSILERSLKPLKNVILAKRIVFVTLMLIILVFFVPVLLIKDKGYFDTNLQYSEAMNIMKEDFPSYFRIYNYPLGHNRFAAFKFGNDYCGLIHTETLKSLYPNTYFYDSRIKGFIDWNLPVGFEELLYSHGNRILLSGFTMEKEDLDILNNAAYPFTQILHYNTQAIYVLDTSTLLFQNRSIRAGKSLEIIGDMEATTNDGNKFVFQENVFGSGNLQSRDISRSGNYSIKLSGKIEYALDFTLDNFYPGSSIYSHIWRYPSGSKTKIVFSAENSDEFYILSSKSVETDKDGWEKIELYFQNPLTGNKIDKLKFYLWNNEQETVYFDDLYLIQK